MNQSRRRADAARNDDLLLDAALELLREKGPDRIAALDLARLAKLTTGAVYARYENNEEILVGLWQHRISGPMRAFFEASLPALTPGLHRAEAQAIMARTISNPPWTIASRCLIADCLGPHSRTSRNHRSRNSGLVT